MGLAGAEKDRRRDVKGGEGGSSGSGASNDGRWGRGSGRARTSVQGQDFLYVHRNKTDVTDQKRLGASVSQTRISKESGNNDIIIIIIIQI